MRTVVKRRAPLTIDAALVRIAGQFDGGWDEAAAKVDRSPSYLRACGDPERREKLSVDDAIALDLAYEEAGGQGLPLYECYGSQLEIAAAARFQNNFDLLRRTAAVIREGGEAHAALVRACLPNASPNDQRDALRELSEAYEEIKPLLAILQQAVGTGPTSGIDARERSPP